MKLLRFDAEAFLRDTWQKKPLLIRNPWDHWENPLEPDDFAGLACEDGVEARLVERESGDWNIEHGPLPEARFGELGKKVWTLLIQAVDHHVPEVAELIEAFRFIPNWRIDDVMVSYAADNGGVGAHFDQYDVFLVQGSGKRRWQIGAACDAATPMLPHDDLRLLADFQPCEEWILEPGDILYLPPRIAHNGVALGKDCMTYSIGFRAPSCRELIAHWCDHVLDEIEDEDRFEDPDLRAQDNPGEISAQAIAALYSLATDRLLDRSRFTRWFGQYNSTRKYPDIDWTPQEDVTSAQLRRWAADSVPLRRNPASRFSFIRQQDGPLLLFVDGQCHECTAEVAALAQMLCAQAYITIDPTLMQSGAAEELLLTLCNQGSAEFDPAA
jgi:50S ribosomal protein L16 3-hydroxylase